MWLYVDICSYYSVIGVLMQGECMLNQVLLRRVNFPGSMMFREWDAR